MKKTAMPRALASLEISRVCVIATPISFVASACEFGPNVKPSATIAE